MGADKHERLKRNRLPPFVPLLVGTIDAPAWRSLSHGARSLYLALKRRYIIKAHNNGHIYLSQRDAAHELNSHHDQIGRWYRELQHYGFIIQTATHLTPQVCGKTGTYRRNRCAGKPAHI
jgi:hypothetical protein